MSKITCETTENLSIFRLKKAGILGSESLWKISWSSNFGGDDESIELIYSFNSDPNIRLIYQIKNLWSDSSETLDYTISLTTSRCHYGGKRYWFICPLMINKIPCQRRVGVLYLVGKYFGCRKCQEIVYNSQKSRYGFRGFFRHYFRLGCQTEEKLKNTRVKFWRGQPTKRFRKILEKQKILSGFGNNQEIFDEAANRLVKLLNSTKK